MWNSYILKWAQKLFIGKESKPKEEKKPKEKSPEKPVTQPAEEAEKPPPKKIDYFADVPER